MPRSVSLRLLALLALAVAAAQTVSAQECIGLPSQGRGTLTYGFEGTDGATGSGLAFAFHGKTSAIVVEHQSLDGFTMVDRMRTLSVLASRRLPAGGVPKCLVAGANWTSYSNDRNERSSWYANDPGYITERIRIGGGYRRLRVPAGVAFGKAYDVRGRFSIIPHFAGTLVGEYEENDSTDTQPARSRFSPGIGLEGGITFATSWLVIRSTVSHTRTHAYALSSRHNYPELALHAGVIF
jgi:hypothetical protein